MTSPSKLVIWILSLLSILGEKVMGITVIPASVNRGFLLLLLCCKIWEGIRNTLVSAFQTIWTSRIRAILPNPCTKERLLWHLACVLSDFWFVCIKTPVDALIPVLSQEEPFFRIECLFANKLFNLSEGCLTSYSTAQSVTWPSLQTVCLWDVTIQVNSSYLICVRSFQCHCLSFDNDRNKQAQQMWSYRVNSQISDLDDMPRSSFQY